MGAGVRVPHAAALTFTGPFSIAVWVNPTASQAAQPQWAWVEKWGRSPAGGTSGYMLRMDAARKAKFSLAAGGSSDQVLSVSAVPAETWTHVAAVYDGSRGHLYVNGKRERSEAMKLKPGENASPLSIGAAPQGGNRFTGALDDVRLYDRALSEAEVASLAAEPPK